MKIDYSSVGILNSNIYWNSFSVGNKENIVMLIELLNLIKYWFQNYVEEFGPPNSI